MEFTIYFDDKPLLVTDRPSAEQKATGMSLTAGYEKISDHLTHEALTELMKGAGERSAFIRSADVAATREIFLSVYKLVEAAGGVVQNEKKEILFIYRRGKWDLPKGKLDEGESPEDCAAREIEEETGAGALVRRKKILETFHIYSEKKTDIIKKTYWYHFTTDSDQKLQAQADEDITEVKWVPTQNISEPMADTYESIRAVLRAFFDRP